MKRTLRKLLPVNLKDLYFWFLVVVIILPFVYLALMQNVNYMTLNSICLCVFSGIFLYCFLKKLAYKSKFKFVKSPALIILICMFAWIFIGSFFAQDLPSTWLGKINGSHAETSVFQYIFYCVCALCALGLDKRNIKYILWLLIFVANVIIIVQFCVGNFGFGFINKNHTGYYLSVTIMLVIGMLLKSNSIIELCLLSISLLLHLTSLVLNNSMGPILGLVTFFIVGAIYYLVHNKQVLIRFFSILLTCVAVFSFFDYVPVVKNLKDEPMPVATQLIDVSLVGLNKIGIISDEKFKEIMADRGGISPGSDGYSRFDMWERSLNNMAEFPLFGVGVGSWKIYNPDMPSRRPHNEFLQYGAEAGIPTLALYLTLIIYLFVMFRKKHIEQSDNSFVVFGAIVVYLVQSMFGNLLPFTAPAFYIMIGLAIKFIDFNKNNYIFTPIIKENNDDLSLLQSEHLKNDTEVKEKSNLIRLRFFNYN